MGEPKDFGFGEEEALVRDSARKLLDERVSVEKLRALVAKDHDIYEKDEAVAWDESVWSTMVELGFPALVVPEAAGGMGGKKVTIAAVVEQLGLHACPSPLIATLSAGEVLAAAGANPALERIANGTKFALACFDDAGEVDFTGATVGAKREGDFVVLDGTAAFVQDGGKAESYVVVAKLGDGPAILVVDRATSGLTVKADHIVDLTRDQVKLVFAGAKVSASAVVAEGEAASKALNKALPMLLTMVAADLVGISEWQLRTTAEYAKVREQFGRPIGTFQAVKHPIVDMMLGIDQARSLVYAAASAADHSPERAELLARMAKAKASDVGRYCSGRSVQLHGGIGFTWECDVHMFFKRSEHNQVLFGDGAQQRARIASLLG